MRKKAIASLIRESESFEGLKVVYYVLKKDSVQQMYRIFLDDFALKVG